MAAKQKTHRASAKRFKRTGNGGLKRNHAYTSHRFHGKTVKQRRQLRSFECRTILVGAHARFCFLPEESGY